MKNVDMELEKLSSLIGLIYEGATDSNRWAKEILPAVAEYIGAPECILFTNLVAPQNGGYFFMHGISQDHVDLYMNKYISHDLWTKVAIERNLLTEGGVFIGEDIVPRQQLLESKFYKECLSRDENMAQLLTSIIFGAESGKSMSTVLSIFRGLHHPDFTQNDVRRISLLLPHLSRSLGVLQRLKISELKVATSMAALDRLPSGILLLDGIGQVSFVNVKAQKMLNENDGLRLSMINKTTGLGRLVADNAVVSKAIDYAIGATLNQNPFETSHFSNSIKVPRISKKATYDLQFSSLGEHVEFGDGTGAYSTIIFMMDSEAKLMIDSTILQNIYELTQMETKVALLLLELDSPQEVADQLGTSLNTVLSQLKQVYSKLGVNTRTRFVKMMMGLSR